MKRKKDDSKAKALSLVFLTILVTSLLFVGFAYAADSDTSTDVNNVAPSASSVSAPDPIDPGTSDNTISFDVSDDNGVGDLSQIEVFVYRSDVNQGDGDDARNHWTITWDGSSWSISPSELDINVSDDVDTGSTTDSVSIDIDDVPDYAAPSQGTGNNTVDDYTWSVDVEVTDSASQTGTASTNTEVSRKLAMSINTSSISTSVNPGETSTYSPDIELSNNGNVWIELNYSATDQTDEDENTIPASSMYLDDDADHGEDTETGLSEQNYDTTTKTWSEMDLEYSDSITLSNFVEAPNGLPANTYTGSITLTEKQSHAE